jgi:hypothetical protein
MIFIFLREPRNPQGLPALKRIRIFDYFAPLMTFSRRAVQMEKLQFEVRCSKNTKIRGAQFKCKNNILTPSIGKKLQLSFRVPYQ